MSGKCVTPAVVLGILAGVLLFGRMDVSGAEQEESARRVFARWLMDRGVVSREGRSIGEIDDLVIKRSGRVKTVVVELEGFLEFGDKLVAVPLVRTRKKGPAVQVDASAEAMENAPEFSFRDKGLYSSYYFRTGPDPDIPAAPGGAPEPGRAPDFRAYSPSRYLASVLLGRPVTNRRGERLGTVQDLLIDDGRVDAYILSRNGLMGVDKYVAAPYRAPGFGPDGIVYDISPKAAGALPRYPYGALVKEPLKDGPFGPVYGPPGVVEPDVGPETNVE